MPGPEQALADLHELGELLHKQIVDRSSNQHVCSAVKVELQWRTVR